MASKIVDGFLPSDSHMFDRFRGIALGRYIDLEAFFVPIFHYAVGARTPNVSNARKSQVAGIAFQKLVNSSSRNAVLKESLDAILGKEHAKLSRRLGAVDVHLM